VPNAPKENHRESIDEKSRFSQKFRLAVTFVLGLGGGIAITSFFGDHACQSNQPAITDVGGSRGVGGVGPDGKPWPKNQVSSDKFDKKPEEYVDVDQCRALVLKWDGTVVTDDEVVAKAEDIMVEKRLAQARNLISKLCLTDGRDTMGIENAFLEGYTEFYWSENERGCHFLVNLIKKGEGENTICLEGPPPCEPSLSDVSDEGRKNMEEIAQRKEKIQKLKEMGYGAIFEKVDLAAMKDEIKRLNLSESHWVELVKRIEMLKTMVSHDESAGALALETCKLYGFMFGAMKDFEEDEEGVPDSPIFKENMEHIEDFTKVVLEANGLRDEEECIKFLK